jgi:tripartite ATP-independent transporter DctP family solute receptor
MITRRSLIGASMASAAIATTIARPRRARAAEFVWKWGHSMPTTHSVNVRGNEAIERIAKESNGRIEIRMFPDNQLGGDNDMSAQIRNGGIDLYSAAATSIGPLVPFVGISNMAFAFQDSAQAWKALDGDLGKLVIAAFAKVNLHAFDRMWSNGFREITTAPKPIKSAADLVGFKIRVPTSPVLLSLFRGLGAAPTSMNVSELYTALQTRIVDGQENPLSVIATRNFNEVQKYCALTNHVFDSFVMVANMEAWKGLPGDLQQIVARNLNEAAVKQREDADRQNISLQKDLEAKGMTFNTPEIGSFREALKKSGFYAQWQKTYGEEPWKVLEQYTGKLA